MKWTNAQERAITEKDHNIVVSAAAGSGKTAVLVERIKRLVMENKIPIDRFLVVTFTNAAAAEMKEKLTKAFKDQLKASEGDLETQRYLREQLALIGGADISTFDGFALKVDREFFQFADLDPKITIGDEVEMRLLAQDAMDETIAAFFEEGSPDFHRFLDRFSNVGSEDRLKDKLLKTYDKLRSFPNYFTWLSRRVSDLKDVTEETLYDIWGDALADSIITAAMRAKAYYERALNAAAEAGVTSIVDVIEPDVLILDELLRDADGKGPEELLDTLSLMPRKSLNCAKAEKELYLPVKDLISGYRSDGNKILNELQKKYAVSDKGEAAAAIRDTYEDGAVLLALLQYFEDIYRAKKQDVLAMDFADIEHYAIRILAQEEAASVYRDKYRYIFIDEYQDSNYLQEAIIDRIKGEDNLFMVGDVKQSIYGFRLAEPKIFTDRYRAYSEEGAGGIAIDLNENFRSKSPVIDTVNEIFEHLMDGYDDAARLYAGLVGEQDINYPVYLEVIHTDEGGEEDDALAELMNAELEALRVCDIAEHYLNEPYYDSKNGKIRRFKPSDMVLLLRSVKTFAGVYKEYLAQRGIGAFIEENSGYFDTLEVATFMDLLRIIDNNRRDLPLLSVLRSMIFGYTTEELIAIRLYTKDASFCEAFYAYESNGPDEKLRAKVQDSCSRLATWKRRAAYMPLDEFMAYLLDDTGYEAMIGALIGGDARLANIRTLVDLSVAAMSIGRDTVYDFLRYLSAVEEKGNLQIGSTGIAGDSDELIRIMTIHKSKGLEFPLVMVAGLGKRYAGSKSSRDWTLDREVGIAFTGYSSDAHLFHGTLLTNLINDRNTEKEREEAIRVLYVACTRARDVLVLLGTMKGQRPENSYLRDLLPIFEMSDVDRLPVNHLTLDDLTTKETERYFSSDTHVNGKELTAFAVTEEIKQQIERAMGYIYPYEAQLGIKSKYAVTELLQQEALAPTIQSPAFIQRDEQADDITGALLGIAYHTVLEHLDFLALLEKGKATDFDPIVLQGAIEDLMADLVRREILLPKEADAVDASFLAKFMAADEVVAMEDARAIHKETPFTLRREEDGREVLIQGIIDLWYETDEGIVLLDYKSNHPHAGLKAYYRPQIDMYKEALEQLTKKPVVAAYLYLIRTGEFLPM